MPVLDPSTHDDLVPITINLAALSSGGQGFRLLILGVDITLNGDRTTTYSSVAAATADEDAGYIDTWTLAAVTEAFGQSPRPDYVTVGKWTKTGGSAETIAAALDAIIAETTDFWAILLGSRDGQDAEDLGAKLTTLAADGYKFIGIVQSNDADWLTSGIAVAYTDLAGHERIAVVFHGTDAAPRAEGWAANRLARDPDDVSVPWNAPVAEVYAFTADTVTQAQKEFARANYANIALPFGTRYDAFFDPGKTLAGRAIDQLLSADWFEVRLREALADLIATMADNGEKLGVNSDGQNRIVGTFNRVAATGVQAGHFEAGQVIITALAITDADRTAQRLRFTAAAQHVVGVRTVPITVNLSTSPVVE
jgi:hypothetical protein